MKRVPTSCDREPEVLELCLTESWPSRADEDLRLHVRTCASCDELIAVACALADVTDRQHTRALPDAALVWHRAQMRARHEAALRAERPLVFIEVTAVAVACLIFLLGAWAMSLGDVASRMAHEAATAAANGVVAMLGEPGVDAHTAILAAPRARLLLVIVGLYIVVLAAGAALTRSANRADEV